MKIAVFGAIGRIEKQTRPHPILYVVFLILSILVGCSPPDPPPPTETVSYRSDIVVHEYETYDITIAHVPKVEFIYNVCASLSVEQMLEERPYEYLINSSFFHEYGTYTDEDVEGCQYVRRHLVHVGHLRFDGTTYPSKEMNTFDHDQLTHIVQYEPAVPHMTFVPEDAFVSLETADVIEFQTGPIVIHNNQVAQAEIDNSFNGEGKYPRSLIATTDQTEIFLLTVRQGVTLDALGEFLLTLELFQGKRLDVLNLDGGLSTLVYAPRHQQMYWSSSEGDSDGSSHDPRKARLPFFIGVPDL